MKENDMNREAAMRALHAIADSVVDAVKVAGDHGAPGGVLYAALMRYGCTLEHFEQIMGALVVAKKVVKRGQLYFAVK
jgi:hypothetical protein